MSFGKPLLVAVLAVFAPWASAEKSSDEGTPPQVLVETELGSFTVKLLPQLAKDHVRAFLRRVNAGDYDRTTFHRLIPGEVIQGGDPITKDPKRTADYGRGAVSEVHIEHSDHPFARGSVVAARCPTDSDHDGTQFFVLLEDAPVLKGRYTIFGEVVSGMEVADAIGAAGTDLGRPRRRIEIRLRVLP